MARRKNSIKQNNKTHKSTHRSKRQVTAISLGKIEKIKRVQRNKLKLLSKIERRNAASIKLKINRCHVNAAVAARGGASAAPLLVAIVPLAQSCSPVMVAALLRRADPTALVTLGASSNVIHVSSAGRFKKRLELRTTRWGAQHFLATLDVAKVADVVICLCPSDVTEFDQQGENMLSCLYAQGIGSVIFAFSSIGLSIKAKQECRRVLHSQLSARFSLDTEVRSLDSSADALSLLRQLCSQRLGAVTYREARCHLIAEQWSVCAESGQLRATGYLRGAGGLLVNSWVHIPGWGDFPLERVSQLVDPHPLRASRVVPMDGSDAPVVLAVAQSRVDEIDANEEIADDSNDSASEESTEDDEELSEMEDIEEDEYADERLMDSVEKADDMNEDSDGERPIEIEDIRDADIKTADSWPSSIKNSRLYGSGSEDARSLARFREARQEALYPDEKDTPNDVAARDRFRHYRGLESLRNSQWDPKENLPHGYTGLVCFQNYSHTRRRLIRRLPSAEDVCAAPGVYVQLELSQVPAAALEHALRSTEHPLVLFVLLAHENRSTIVHCTGRLRATATEPLKSKDIVVVQAGFRRFAVAPLISERGPGSERQSRLLKYLRPEDGTAVLSFRGPVLMAPLPILMWSVDGFLKNDCSPLITGSVMTCEPRRCILKRLLLSGHPFKVNHRHAVVRYMFFQADDVRYFRKVALHTKRGRRGHILEPLGTHGHMKCKFDGPITNMDVVLMPLYKRVFPQITFDACIDLHLLEKRQSSSKPLMEAMESIESLFL